jgi:CRISPR-associated protein Cas1
MAVIYVKEPGATIHKRGGRLVVEKDDKPLAEIPLRETDLVAVLGNVQVSTQALSELLDRGIPVGLYTRNGRLKGRVVPESGGAVKLRLAQMRAATAPAEALRLAIPVVHAKLMNAAAVVEGQRANHPSEALALAADLLRREAAGARAAAGLEELMGHEGAGAAAYFRVFGEMNSSDLPFPGRQKHPPPDPVNALLSLVYTMAMNELRGMAEGRGLDPYLGFLHAPEDNRPSLALDLLEPFRPSLADRLVLRLVNQRILTGADFLKRVSGPAAGGVALRPESWKRYLEAYEDAMQTPRRAAPRGMRAEMDAQVTRLAAALRDGREFAPFLEGEECGT